MTSSLRSTMIATGGVALLLVVLGPLPMSAYVDGRITQAVIFVGLAISWNVIGGFAGQLSIGQAAFFGVGAYGAAEAVGSHGLGTLPALGVAVVLAAVAALIVVPCFRARGAYFAVLTLALAAIAMRVAERYAPGGNSGIFYEAFEIDSSMPYLLAAGGVVVAMALCVFVLRSKMGRGLAAVRMDLDAARSVGVRDMATRTQALLLSAAIAGYFGGLYALTLGFLDPGTAFSLDWSVAPLLAVVLGGMGTLLGPVIGGAIWFGLEEAITQLGFTSDTALILQGAILLGIALAAPRGIVGVATDLWRLYRDRDRGEDGADPPPAVEGRPPASAETGSGVAS